jgi:hypothetical protein
MNTIELTREELIQEFDPDKEAGSFDMLKEHLISLGILIKTNKSTYTIKKTQFNDYNLK